MELGTREDKSHLLTTKLDPQLRKQLFLQIGGGYCCFYKGREENARIMCSSIKIITSLFIFY